MTQNETDVRVLVERGAPVERLVCHPRLPLAAGLDSRRPTVYVWDLTSGQAREVAAIATSTTGYGSAVGWERDRRTPSVSWHPHDPLLVLTGMGGLRRWTPDGVTAVDGPPADGAYRAVAFSPDGRTVWAVPGSGREDDWSHSDAVDVASGTVRTGPEWDTGVTAHPGGGLVVTLRSDQGATLGLFARVDAGAPADGPAAMRVLRRALILSADGYQAPLFSPDGRYLVIRGNAYEHRVCVFEFPSLRTVLVTSLSSADPGYPPPPEWMAEYRAWAWHNLAFAPSGVLLIGTPAGTVVELDVATHRATEHPVLDRDRVTAVAATASGQLLVAGGSGRLALVRGPWAGRGGAADATAARERVDAFLAATPQLPDDADLDADLDLTDGTTTWTSEELETTEVAADTDPAWLQIRAFMNAARATHD